MRFKNKTTIYKINENLNNEIFFSFIFRICNNLCKMIEKVNPDDCWRFIKLLLIEKKNSI